jgi:ABC-type transport system involved in cytochrome bd biosynthesis fused ATPase/permease subunit
VVRDRDDARWLPSRFHHGLFRLFAFVRMYGTAPRERRGIMLAIDPDQSTGEQYAIALWTTATVSCFFAAFLPLAVAIVLAPLALLIPLFIFSRGLRFHSILFMTLISIAAAYFAMKPIWIRYVAWQFLALMALNAIAALIMLPLRGQVRKMEERCGL